MRKIVLFEKKKLKSEIFYKQIKEMIIKNELEAGFPLSERKLCEILDASRTPVREALKRLASERFVDMTPEYGVFVSKISYENITEIYDIREMLEALSVRIITLSNDERKIKFIAKITEEFRAAMEKKDYDRANVLDIKFHGYLINECENKRLKEMLIPIFDHTRRITRLTKYNDEWAHLSLSKHLEIVEKIKSGDVKAAEEAMREHIRESKQNQLKRWIK